MEETDGNASEKDQKEDEELSFGEFDLCLTFLACKVWKQRHVSTPVSHTLLPVVAPQVWISGALNLEYSGISGTKTNVHVQTCVLS